ncbi:nicotinate-nucleotide adenylyltransferase [Mycoplasmopsis mustelae]|uniref:Probable nicotinate-nucleotide adenylyltransferase n=1 Tax=Mycoplasmopsis mustelae TaxID=171289 RepID=A0A4V3FNV0_9BACT|nr:nicotinate-nucleotide adenylyltransferase [Mycoplasmopsis mustelae]TDV23043.1 nicotinate-nucleotide adenylyltransferase [Mycoplasmopsis mustelae]
MKIGIFGGSFNPIHKGHIKLARYAIKYLHLDKLLLVPTYVSPFKTKTNLIKPIHKVEMIKLVLEEKMELCDFEIKQNSVSYTFQTLKYLKHKYPNDELFLLIGSDNLSKLHKWKNIDLIAELSQIVIFKRETKINKTNFKKYHCLLLDNPILKYSSTDFKKGNCSLIDDRVLNYIQAHGLYLEKILHNTLSALRAKHSVATAEFAVQLAKKNNYSAKDAYIAGLMHDITKEWDVQKSLEFIKKYQPDFNEKNPAFYHQICGYLWLKYHYKLQNNEILQAIRYHTEMHDNMSMLDKIIFVADKICQGRKFEGIQKIRQLALENLDQGFKAVVERTYQWNKAKKVNFSDKSEKLYQKYINEE